MDIVAIKLRSELPSASTQSSDLLVYFLQFYKCLSKFVVSFLLELHAYVAPQYLQGALGNSGSHPSTLIKCTQAFEV